VRVYVSGAITGVNNWRERFEAGANVLEALGFDDIIIPPDIPACSDGTCKAGPNNPRSNGHTWSCWLKHDLAEMVLCDIVATLPGWEGSRGAVLEVTTAIQLGIQIFTIDAGALDDELIRMEMLTELAEDDSRRRISLVGEVDGL
jgi:Domain of unknown function (DUF4406)